ncbi:MAG: hypothetical protein GOMPHAMPRED_007486 [Gomphillus americanus]|uniref:Uncharacterized protein n=1 Tax=Gomphillus americanus TaxID=1940652 RepID=A0A8H3EQR2_9LECA|nr:MAG: hypothetical protein GOMPHAMPRED_007486 [Gomphillus americanus]
MSTPPSTDDRFVQPRNASPNAKLDPDRLRSPSTSTRVSFDRASRIHNATPDPSVESDDPEKVILESFYPRLFVLASPDTEELVRLKGIYGGLAGLLRPFGERIQGNVVTRDSSGLSKSLAPFGIHFLPFHRLESPSVDSGPQRTPSMSWTNDDLMQSTIDISTSRLQEQSSVMEGVLKNQLAMPSKKPETTVNPQQPLSLPYYTFYLRRLLGGRQLIPYEPYTHPVACLIAISSQSSAPLESLRDLYDSTRQGSRDLPAWLSNEFLRYYILVHDEDHDDINRSTALFDQMKRHFGLHCHMLRLRSTQCGPETQDSVELPQVSWLSATEEAADIDRRMLNSGIDEFKQYLFNSDAVSLRTFVREMVTQSIIPFMEGRINAWNEQVASRRRGISGRFMSLSKRFTFGSGRGSKGGSSTNSNTNYNATLGAYMPDSAEAIMHRLADYAVMLGDWKLASSTYEMLRSDFTDDKSWRHSAFANEMAAITTIKYAHTNASSLKPDIIDQMLDSATYSYLSRCQDPASAVRCLLFSAELYKSHGRIGIKEATKWSDRLLELSILSPLAQSLFTSRIALFFSISPTSGSLQFGSCTRKAALWNLLATELWLLQAQNPACAKESLSQAKSFYTLSNKNNSGTPPFTSMEGKWDQLHQELASMEYSSAAAAAAVEDVNDTQDELDEVREELHDPGETSRKGHQHRLSMAFQSAQGDARDMLQRLNDPSTQEDDGFT